jgi:hypothetical protein
MLLKHPHVPANDNRCDIGDLLTAKEHEKVRGMAIYTMQVTPAWHPFDGGTALCPPPRR